MAEETFKVNMEAITVRGGCVQAIVQLSADDTDAVCNILKIKDEDRGKILLVKDHDVVDDSAPSYYNGANWDAWNRVYPLK